MPPHQEADGCDQEDHPLHDRNDLLPAIVGHGLSHADALPRDCIREEIDLYSLPLLISSNKGFSDVPTPCKLLHLTDGEPP
jgi:hypothetical protein